MSKQIEALKLALEALSASDDFLFNYHDCEPNNEREVDAYSEVRGNNMKAWEAIREALAEESSGTEQPAQQQKPVAWLSVDSIGERYLCFTKPQDNDPVQPLYTSPPESKPWRGLTDEEILIMSRYDLEYAALIGEVQRKLKEKNT